MNDLGQYIIYALSDRAAVIDLGNTISEPLNRKVLAMQSWLQKHPFTGLKDLVVAYGSLTVLYDPRWMYHQCPADKTVFGMVKEKLKEAWAHAEETTLPASRNVSLPVCYDPAFGHDLEEIATAKNISVDELIHIHCATGYRVYMLGFLPGFPYMGKLDERLVMPRRQYPREVPAGAVGIAGWQTGIYPLTSPGGWQIIGRTPARLFNASNEPPVLFSAGDTVQFYPITREEYDDNTKT